MNARRIPLKTEEWRKKFLVAATAVWSASSPSMLNPILSSLEARPTDRLRLGMDFFFLEQDFGANIQ